jgi:probable addiction module antidote protein
MEGANPMTKAKFSPFDVADHIKTPDDAAHYLDAVLADGDANEIAEALGVVARSQGMAAIAEESGLSARRFMELSATRAIQGWRHYLACCAQWAFVSQSPLFNCCEFAICCLIPKGRHRPLFAKRALPLSAHRTKALLSTTDP